MRQIIFVLFVFFIGTSFQIVPTGETVGNTSNGYPYYRFVQLCDLKELVMDERFAGSSYENQLIYRFLSSDYYTVNVSPGPESMPFSDLLFQGDTVKIHNMDAVLIGSSIVRKGEGLWQSVERILREYEGAQNVVAPSGDQVVTSSQPAELKTSAWGNFLSILKGFIRGLLFILAAIAVIVAIYILPHFIIWCSEQISSLREKRRRVKEGVRQAKINTTTKAIQDGTQVDQAGPPQVPGGLTLATAPYRMNSILPGVQVTILGKVQVSFLRNVQVGYAGYNVSVKPAGKDKTWYFLGVTEQHSVVLCAVACGNSILSSQDGGPLTVGVDFRVTEIYQSPEVSRYLELQRVAERGNDTAERQPEIPFPVLN